MEDIYNLYEYSNINKNNESIILPIKIGNDEMKPKLNIKMYIKPNDICPICYENIIRKSDSYLSICGHGFHKKCIFKAYEAKQLSKKCSVFKCPCCRTSLGTDIEEINERYDLFNDKANGLDILESFWIKKDYMMPLICNKHYLGMDKNCIKCKKYGEI
jgi:hypothetical protein